MRKEQEKDFLKQLAKLEKQDIERKKDSKKM